MKRIMIIEDDTVISSITKMLLESCGYEAVTLSDAPSEKDMSELPDLVLLDLSMPKADGRDICKALKSAERTRGIPVILMSGNMDLSDIAEEVSADEFIKKPFDIDHLLSKIRSQIGEHP